VPSVEFNVDGIPVSYQSTNSLLRAGYRAKIQAEAGKAMAGLRPWTVRVGLEMWILTVADVAPENDNVLKLVRDALQGVVYVNDRQVHRDRVLRHDLQMPVTLPGLPDRLAALATRGQPFIYVRVNTDVPWAVIA